MASAIEYHTLLHTSIPCIFLIEIFIHADGERHKLNKFISSLIISGQTYNILNKRNYPVRIRVYNSALISITKKLFIVAHLHVIT